MRHIVSLKSHLTLVFLLYGLKLTVESKSLIPAPPSLIFVNSNDPVASDSLESRNM